MPRPCSSASPAPEPKSSSLHVPPLRQVQAAAVVLAAVGVGLGDGAMLEVGSTDVMDIELRIVGVEVSEAVGVPSETVTVLLRIEPELLAVGVEVARLLDDVGVGHTLHSSHSTSGLVVKHHGAARYPPGLRQLSLSSPDCG